MQEPQWKSPEDAFPLPWSQPAKGFFYAKILPMNSKKRKWAWLPIVPIVLFVTAFTSNKHVPHYSPTKICDDSLIAKIDRYNDNVTDFTIDMHEGCFGALIRVPKEWKTVWYQSEGDTKDWWVSFWLTGQPSSSGPFNGNPTQHLDVAEHWFRIQGHGKIKFYSNDSTPK
jgi:hypothetical protein